MKFVQTRPLSSAFANLDQLIERTKPLETSIASLTKELGTHKEEAQKLHMYYIYVTKQCREAWEKITQLEPNEEKLPRKVKTRKF